MNPTSKGKTKEKTQWQTNWWDFEPLLEWPRRQV
jgi:hypothetical protein